MRWQTLLFFLLVGFGGYQYSQTRPVTVTQTGAIVAETPYQIPLESPPRLTLENYHVEGLS